MVADPALSVAERIDAACDRFEADWKAGRKPQIDVYLAAAPPADREELRRALFAVLAELSGREISETFASETVEHGGGPIEAPAAIGRFEVRDVLGTGAFGRVYRAFDPHLGREVALKVPLAAAVGIEAERARFLREARSAATINHPNVCQIHEVGEHDGRPYIVMALVPGQSLADALKVRKEPLPAKQAALVVRKIALALAGAHDRGVIHRDLKPANVMFDRERKDVIVMDFGLARGPRPGDARSTQSGLVMGTPAYMSPEQARGDAKGVGPAGDVYSLGVILYELLTGTRPFAGTATAVLGQILHVEPEPPSSRREGVDPRLEAICLKAMKKDPAERFASMREFAASIDSALRPPALDRPTAETYAELSSRTAAEPAANNLAEFFTALSADRRESRAETTAAVDAAIARHRTPRWVVLLTGLVFAGGLLALGALTFFTRSEKVKVTIELTNVDLGDRTLSFFLDDEPIPPEVLASPVELKPGEHVLAVRRGRETVRRMLLTVAGGRSPGIRVRDVTPPPTVAKPSGRLAEADRELAGWFLRKGLAVHLTAGELPTQAPTFHAPHGWQYVGRTEDLPAGPFKLIGVEAYGKALDPEVVGRIGEVKNLVYVSLSGCGPFDDRSLEALRDRRDLVWLRLEGTGVTDAGFAHLRGMKRLQRLDLSDTAVTGSGLAELPTASLRWLMLGNATTPGIDRILPRHSELRLLYVRSDEHGDAEARRLVRAVPGVTVLRVSYARLTDEALADLAELKDLTSLDLERTRVSGTGLRHLAGLTDLRILRLGGTPLREDALGALEQLPRLGELAVPNTALTDAGMRRLAGLRNLHRLDLNGTRITDAGLEHLNDWRSLTELLMNNTAVGDAGLEYVATLRPLEVLGAAKTNATDAGLKQLAGLRSLRHVDLTDTRVTPDGLRRLQAALPACKIIPEPTAPLGEHGPSQSSPDRTAAKWALGLGGEIQVEADGKRVSIRNTNDLPAADFRLVAIHLANNNRVTDDGLASLAGVEKLESLNLNGTPITSRGVDRLGSLAGLKFLNLCVPSLRDDDLAALKGLPALLSLEISYTGVGDTGVEHLKGCANLQTLYISETKVTDCGVKKLKDALPGCKIIREPPAPGAGSPPADSPRGAGRGTAEADRKLAEWALSIGALSVTVSADGAPETRVTRLAELPAGTLRVAALDVWGNQAVTDDNSDKILDWLRRTRAIHANLGGTAVGDATVAKLVEIRSLREVLIGGPRITDQSLERLGTLPDLTLLGLDSSAITDSGLVHLRGLPNLRSFSINSTAVSDEGLKHLANSKELRTLRCGWTMVTADGLRLLKNLPLQDLDISQTRLRRSDLPLLRGFPDLRSLWAINLSLADADLSELVGLKKLERMNLTGNRITDEGLKTLAGMRGLKQLFLQANPITPVKLASLRKALPACRIEPAPTSDTPGPR